MSEEFKDNLGNRTSWLRIAYIILFVVIFNVVEILVAVVVIFQVVLTLVTGRRNERALRFGAQLGMYAYQILQYVTYNSDDAPFPFSDWPSGRAAVEVQVRGKDAGAGSD